MVKLLLNMKAFWLKRRRELNVKYKRTLPFADYIVDRWEKADELGFGKGASIYDSSLVIGDVKVGKNTWIGPFTILDGSGGLDIGVNCSISSGVQVYSHDSVKWAVSGGKDTHELAKTVIGDYCFLGPNAIVSKGVTIGDGCIIGANSLVLNDIPAGSKAFGTPCCVVGKVESSKQHAVMKVVFIGSSLLGMRCLEVVRQLPCVEVVGIITNEQKFNISYAPEGVSNVLYADLDEYGNSHGIPVYVMKDNMNEPELLLEVKSWGAELFLIVGWYHFVPKALRNIATAVGLHASMLPDYSGGAPLVWAIINGEKSTGVTFFKFGDGVDDGPIIGQLPEGILPEDNIATLYERIEELAFSLLKEYMPQIADGSVVYTPQNDGKRRTFPQRRPVDGNIDWNQPAEIISNFVRAQTRPYPGAFTSVNGKKVFIWSVKVIKPDVIVTSKPGGIISRPSEKLRVGTGDGGLLEIVNCSDEAGNDLKSLMAGATELDPYECED